MGLFTSQSSTLRAWFLKMKIQALIGLVFHMTLSLFSFVNFHCVNVHIFFTATIMYNKKKILTKLQFDISLHWSHYVRYHTTG